MMHHGRGNTLHIAIFEYLLGMTPAPDFSSVLGLGVARNEHRTRADRQQRMAQKRATARNQREKMKRHHRTSRKGRGKGK